MQLVERLFDVSGGEVLIGGINVKDTKQETLHKTIGYVPQKSVLFGGTVASNIAFGNEQLSIDEIERAATIACASEFVEKLDNGYNTEIAQGGNNLSGGQKQRLAIARAIAKNPKILIFDDSFSALDYATDAQVRANLKRELPNITKIIVAQRIGTIKNADKILVVDEGKIVGEGTHKQLLDTCPVYKGIALSQLKKEEL